MENGGSEQPVGLNIGKFHALRKMMEIIEPMVLKIVPRALKPMVISIVKEVIGPIFEVSLCKVVQEEIQKLEEKVLTGRTRTDVPNGRTLKLKFLDQVSDTRTGGALEGITHKCLKLALLDSKEDVVTSGAASSAEVEMLLLDNSNFHEDNMTHGNFLRSIIPTGEKKKPHFANRVCISLKNGVGDLSGLKLGSGDWIKSRNCRLGARIAQNLGGVTVQDAWTSPFKVTDYRDALNDKNSAPPLTSKVSRLKGICRGGNPCKRLESESIKTVRDFLFWLYVKQEELRKIYGTSRGDCTWKTTVTHAQTCQIDDYRMYSHNSLTEPQMCVIYDVVGKLKGEIFESHFVPIDKMSAERKDHALTLLRSVLEPAAFEQRYKTFFDDEASLLQQFPSISSEIDASSNSQIQHSLNGNNLTLSETIHGLQTTGPSGAVGAIRDTPIAPDYDKRETPSPSDDVSRLVNICKDGQVHKCLRENNISTVEDFLIRLLRDHEGLKRIVNLERPEWEATVTEARASQPGSRMYCYTNLEEKTSVIFNVIGNILGLCFENHFVPTRSLPEKLLRGDAQYLLALARENWLSVKPVDDMNHLQLDPSGGGNQINNAECEMVGESSIGPSGTAFLSTSSRMEPCGETQDFGCWSSAIDHHMETVIDAETRDDATWQCSHGDSLDLEGIGDIIKEYFPGLYAESQLVSNRWKWEQLLCVIRCRFTMRRMRCDSRKRKR